MMQNIVLNFCMLEFFEYNFPYLSENEFNMLFAEAKKLCNSDDVSVILKKMIELLNIAQNN